MPQWIAPGTIFFGGSITAAAAIGINVVFLRYVVGPRRAAAADRTARLLAALAFVDSALRLALVAWGGLEVLFLGLVFEGEPSWILAIPITMFVWTAAVHRYVRRRSSETRR